MLNGGIGGWVWVVFENRCNNFLQLKRSGAGCEFFIFGYFIGGVFKLKSTVQRKGDAAGPCACYIRIFY